MRISASSAVGTSQNERPGDNEDRSDAEQAITWEASLPIVMIAGKVSDRVFAGRVEELAFRSISWET